MQKLAILVVMALITMGSFIPTAEAHTTYQYHCFQDPGVVAHSQGFCHNKNMVHDEMAFQIQFLETYWTPVIGQTYTRLVEQDSPDADCCTNKIYLWRAKYVGVVNNLDVWTTDGGPLVTGAGMVKDWHNMPLCKWAGPD